LKYALKQACEAVWFRDDSPHYPCITSPALHYQSITGFLMTDSTQSLTREQQIVGHMLESIQHCKVLNMQRVEAERGKVTLMIPYAQEIIGNPDTGVIHGGPLTTLMDTACGAASVIALEEIQICPTLDLRIDYMKPATPGEDVHGSAEIYRVSSQVIFARGVAYHKGEKDSPIAHCVATFMRLDPANIQRNNLPEATR
jgi:uncharacterized protein (TIGR00369 family)